MKVYGPCKHFVLVDLTKKNNNALMQIYLSIEYFALKFALITYYVNQ